MSNFMVFHIISTYIRRHCLQDWKPGSAPAAAVKPANNSSALDTEITKQGDLVRSLKSAKAEKAKVDEAVKTLLDLKAKYKAATGQVCYNFVVYYA